MSVYKSQKAEDKIYKTYDILLNKWGVPVKKVKVKTTYGTTHVNVFGNPKGQPLVLFHGVGDDSALMWYYNAKELGVHFKVFAIDTIGGPGLSIPGKEYNSKFDDIVWIDEIFEYFQLDTVNIAGVSHGGYLTQLYTLMRPQKVRKALALASSVPVGASGSPLKTMLKIFGPEAFFPSQKNVMKILYKLSGENSYVFTANPFIMEHYTDLFKGFNMMSMRFHKVYGFTDEQINSIRDKCRYLMGEADPFALLGGKADLEKYGMNVTFYPGVGHGINHEISEEINHEMIQYFES